MVDMERRRVTMKDVSERAGVSRSAVSHVINGRLEFVSEERRKCILRAIKELNYIPNPVARALRKASTSPVGVLTPLHLPYHSPITPLGTELAKRGEEVIYVPLDRGTELDVSSVRQLWASGVRRVLVYTILKPEVLEVVHEMLRDGVAVVGVDRLVDGAPSVLMDRREGLIEAITYLLKLGHRRIFYLVPGILDLHRAYYDSERLKGIHEAFARYGLEYSDELIVQDGVNFTLDVDGGYGLMTKTLTERELPDAVFAHNDEIAMGAIRAIHDAGKTVPDDISVVGFDGYALGKVFCPSLTTIAKPHKDVARLAVKLLFEDYEKLLKEEDKITYVSPHLTTRESTAKPKHYRF